MKRKVIPFWSKENRDFSNLRLTQFVVDGIWYLVFFGGNVCDVSKSGVVW